MNDEIVTHEMIDSQRTSRGGFSRVSLAWLGVAWPPPKGWKFDVLGKPRKPISVVSKPYKGTVPVPEDLQEKVLELFVMAGVEAARRWNDHDTLLRMERRVIRRLAERFDVRTRAIRMLVRSHRLPRRRRHDET